MLVPMIADAQAVQQTGLQHKVLPGKPGAPVVFLVHGRAGSFDVMWAFRRCIPEGMTIIAPQAPLADPLGGFSWWSISENREAMNAAARSAAGLLLSFMERAAALYAPAPSAEVKGGEWAAVGFSQGAGLLSVVVQGNRNPLARIALLAGFVIPVEPFSKQFDTRVLMLNGVDDQVATIEEAHRGAGRLRSMGFEVEVVEDAVAHKVGPLGMRRLRSWFEEWIHQGPK